MSDETRPETITARFQFGLNDVARAAKSTKQSRGLVLYLGIFTFAVLASNVGPLLRGRSVSSTQLLMWAGFLAMTFFFYTFARRRQLQRTLEGKQQADLDITFQFDAQGFSVHTQSSDSRCAWSAIHHYNESPSDFLLYPTPYVVHVVPKRALSEADINALRELLRANVKPRGASEKRFRFSYLIVAVIVISALYNLFAR